MTFKMNSFEYLSAKMIEEILIKNYSDSLYRNNLTEFAICTFI